MKITEIKIEIVKPNEGLVGFASLIIDDSIYLSGIAIYKKINGEDLRLLYPKKSGFDIWHPINKIASKLIEDAIFSKFKDVMSKVYDRYNNTFNSYE